LDRWGKSYGDHPSPSPPLDQHQKVMQEVEKEVRLVGKEALTVSMATAILVSTMTLWWILSLCFSITMIFVIGAVGILSLGELARFLRRRAARRGETLRLEFDGYLPSALMAVLLGVIACISLLIANLGMALISLN
jgi:hypothetical protein